MSRYSAPTPAPNAPVALGRRSLSGQNAKVEGAFWCVTCATGFGGAQHVVVCPEP